MAATSAPQAQVPAPDESPPPPPRRRMKNNTFTNLELERQTCRVSSFGNASPMIIRKHTTAKDEPDPPILFPVTLQGAVGGGRSGTAVSRSAFLEKGWAAPAQAGPLGDSLCEGTVRGRASRPRPWSGPPPRSGACAPRQGRGCCPRPGPALRPARAPARPRGRDARHRRRARPVVRGGQGPPGHV